MNPSRRGFLKLFGVGTAVVVAAPLIPKATRKADILPTVPTSTAPTQLQHLPEGGPGQILVMDGPGRIRWENLPMSANGDIIA